MTPCATTETVDGMSLRKIQAIIEALRYERYLCGRLAAGLHRNAAGGRGDQGQDRELPVRAYEAGTLWSQDLDHPRAEQGSLLPRLRNCGPRQRRQARSERSPLHQWADRAENADGCRAHQAQALRRGKPAAILARAPDSDFRIVARYQAEFRGIAEYYQLAYNRHGTQEQDQRQQGLEPLPHHLANTWRTSSRTAGHGRTRPR
jgi:hypothetical protein